MLESRLVPLQKRLPTQILAPRGAKRQVLKMCQKCGGKNQVLFFRFHSAKKSAKLFGSGICTELGILALMKRLSTAEVHP